MALNEDIGSTGQGLEDDKLAAIEAFMKELTDDFKNRRVSLGPLQPVRKYLLQAAIRESGLEGQIKELRLENKRLNLEVQTAHIQNIRQEMDSADGLMHARLEGQIDILKDENTKLSAELEDFKLEVFKLKTENDKLKEEAAKLRAESSGDDEQKVKLEAELRILKEQNELFRATPSYAMMASTQKASKQVTAVETRIQKAKEKQSNVLFLKSTDNKSTKEVKEVLTKALDPKQDKVKIKGIRTTPHTVIVETATKADADKVAQKASGLPNIACEETRKRRPMVIVYQVPDAMPDAEFLDQLYRINLSDHMSQDEFKKEVTLKFKSGRKNSPKSHNVLDVSPRVWCTLIKNERVYIGFESLRVKDFARVSRCYTCHDLGHSTKQCRLKEPVCYKCAKPGHLQAACKEQEIGCIPCMYRKRPCDKKGGADCVTHKQLLEKIINNTDYGQ